MSTGTSNMMCIPRGPDGSRAKAPRLILGLMGPGGPAELAEAFRKEGWDVVMAANGEEARRLAHHKRTKAVVMPVVNGQESGLLTCAKLVRTLPRVRVVLVGPADEETERFALFAGAAAYLPERSTTDAVIQAVVG